MSGVAILVITFSSYKLHLNAASVVLLYLLVIVWQSLGGEFPWSAMVSLIAAACLDYFFLPPLLSFGIADPPNVLAFIVFLVVALVITHLVSKVRAEAERAQRRGANLEQLYDVARQLLLTKPDRINPEFLVKTIAHRCAPAAVCIFDAETTQVHLHGTSECDLAERTRKSYLQNADFDNLANGIVVRCLRAGSANRGAIGFEGLPDPNWLAGPLSLLAATVLEQTRIFRTSSEEIAAAQAEAFRTAILDALAHEFKTPLATMLAVVGGLRESPRLQAEELEMAQIIEFETSRLSSLTTRLLHLARLDREEVKPRVKSTNIPAFVERVARRYAAQFPDFRITVNHDYPCVESPADRELLDLALTQLLDNAHKYSIADSPVTLEIKTEEEAVVIRVRNEGSSIAPSERDRIFDRFYRGTGVRNLVSGAGLGLYVARKIVVAHGGSLALDNSTSNGTVVFSLRLPVSNKVADKVYDVPINN